MALTPKKALAIANKYTNDSVAGAGAVAGKPCQIQSITDITGGHRVTFLWVDNSDVSHTSVMNVMDGAKGDKGDSGDAGIGIKSVVVNAEDHLIITYDDDTTQDAGQIQITAAVDSVNGKTGEVTLTASDVGALPSDTAIPSKTSDLTNDSNFVADANYVHTDNNYDATAKGIVDNVTTALAGKVDKEIGKSLIDLTTVVDGASYDSTNHLILFKNGTTTLFSLDAAAFVKDGMVDTVTITGGNLVITFNTDAGKQAINIPITDIFDPANYYDKTATDNLLADKADKVASATNGNFAGLDANGNLTDSGKKASDFGTADEIADIVNVYGAKNLIPYPYLNESGTEFRGVTYTVNADGSVTANGTATGGDSAFFILQRNVDNDFLSRIGQGNFILSGCPANGSLQTYYLNFNYGDAQSSVGNLGQDTGNGKEITIDTDITQYNAQISVLIREGVTVSNLTFYPMLRMASVKDDTYVPYAPTNAKLNEEKMSYADNGVLGAKNLLRNTATSQTVNNVAFTVNSDDKTVNVTRTAEQTEIATRDLYVVSDEDYKLLAGKTLLMTGCPSGGSNDTYYLECYYNDGTGHWLRDVGNGLKITLPATKPTTIKFLIGIKVASVIPSGGLTFKPMIRLASDPDDTYQPYAMTNKQLTDKIQNFGDVILSSEDDMDEKRPMGIYPFTTAPLHSPEGLTYGVLINVINGHTNEQQYVMKGSTGVIYARSLATSSPTRTWTSWFKFTGTVVS